MKIIKKPKLAPTVFHCRACGCVYEAEYGEYNIYSDVFTQTYHKTLKECKCPMCKAVNQVNDGFEEE